MLFTTSATQPGGKRRGFMGGYGLGLVLRPNEPDWSVPACARSQRQHVFILPMPPYAAGSQRGRMYGLSRCRPKGEGSLMAATQRCPMRCSWILNK
jgi:hypothetical protein